MFAGLASLPIFGWSLGTLCGSVLDILHEIIAGALGIALLVCSVLVAPKAKESFRVLAVVLT